MFETKVHPVAGASLGCGAMVLMYGAIFCAIATVSMVPIHFAITSWLSIFGKSPEFSWGACWLIGLFPPMFVISIIASILAVIIPAFM